MPADCNTEKKMASRTMFEYATENIILFFWLIQLSLKNSASMFLVRMLLKHNQIDGDFGNMIDDVSQEAVEQERDVRKDLMFVGQRVLTIRAVVEPGSIESAANAPLRSHFQLPSALLDGYGKDPFLHRSTGFFEKDKAVFKRALFNGKGLFDEKMQEHFNLALENEAQWETTPVKIIARRMVYAALAETFLGLKNEHITRVYEELTVSIDEFDRMWQNPNELKPIKMFMLLQTLERISNQLHQERGPAELVDVYVDLHHRPMNLTAIFFVAANLVKLVSAAILHVCTKEKLQEEHFDDLAKILATWRFRESRIFRIDMGIISSSAPGYSIGQEPCLPRSITVIPQGNINHQRIQKNELFNESGQAKEPELFGRRRPCPGASTAYNAVKSVFFTTEAKKIKFVPNDTQIKQYNDFVDGLSLTAQRQRTCESPPVVGHWSPIASV